MASWIEWLIRRLRPRVGWGAALLAFGAALSPALAAGGAELPLPGDQLGWGGFLGLVLGLRFGSRAGLRPGPWRATARIIAYLLASLGLAALLLLSAASALPPPALLLQDADASWAWLREMARPGDLETPPPVSLSGRFLAETLPRFWEELMAAPGAGEAGAVRLITLISLLTTLGGAIALGWALGSRRPLFGWGLPILCAMALTTILGGGSGAGLVVGLGLLLSLALVAGFRRRELAWETAGIDYSGELFREATGWGVGGILAIVALALLIPTALPVLSEPLAPPVELPSGIAAMGRNVERPRAEPRPEVVQLSRLPAVPLGISLEADRPEREALLVRLDAPLPAGPWPRYWRTRVLTSYNGRAWSAAARVSPGGAPQAGAEPPPGVVVQEVEDLRATPLTLAALPDVIGLSVPADVELLPDGSLAALTRDEPPRRYTVFSQLQAPGAVEFEAGPPPNMSDSLSLPQRLPARVGDLARAIAGDGTAYEQALALESYLRELPYAYEVQPLPGDGDAVDQFLFDMRQGYCTYYASAMAVMARSLGIPARMAVGYATGEYDPARGLYIVREADAHAWPELYIDGRWLPFEPTPARPLPNRGGGAAAPEPVVVPPSAVEEPNNSLLWIWGLAGLVLLAAGGGGWLIWRRRAISPITRAQLLLERQGARAGVPWPAGATLREYARLLEAHAGSGGPAGELASLIAQARYSGRPLSDAEERRLRRAGVELRAWLRRGRKVDRSGAG